jgi:hypothetical protein
MERVMRPDQNWKAINLGVKRKIIISGKEITIYNYRFEGLDENFVLPKLYEAPECPLEKLSKKGETEIMHAIEHKLLKETDDAVGGSSRARPKPPVRASRSLSSEVEAHHRRDKGRDEL